MTDADTTVQTVKLPTALNRSARRRMVDDGLTYQRLLSAAVEAYVAGEWTPGEEDGR